MTVSRTTASKAGSRGVLLALSLVAALALAACAGDSDHLRFSDAGIPSESPKASIDETASPQEAARELYASGRIGMPLADHTAPPPEDRQHFIEFRSRLSYAYGHTYMIFGRLDEDGEIIERDGAGLSPVNRSAIPFVLGHVIPVGSETTTSVDELNNDDNVSARWRILLSETEYEAVVAHIRDLQSESIIWHAALSNCNAFAARVASFMGYGSAFVWLPPTAFINSTRNMNARHAVDPALYAELGPARHGTRQELR